MPSPPRFIFTSDGPPDRGNASGLVQLRHLERLRSLGPVLSISITPPVAECPFPHVTVPLRRPGFFPPREWLPGSIFINQFQKAWYLHRTLKISPADEIISCVHQREHPISRLLSRLSGARLTCLLHDLWPPEDERSAIKTLRQSRRIFAVSRRLAELAATLTSRNVHVSHLYPIGEDPLPPPFFSPDRGAIGIAGTLSPSYVEIALRFGSPVEAVGGHFASHPGLKTVPRFAHNRDALVYLQDHCRALMVYQDPALENYCRYSFPSRLIDFTQTGLPILIVASPTSNLGQWAADHRWRLWVKPEDDARSFQPLRRLLDDPAEWQKESDAVRTLSRGEFNAGRIQQALVDALAPGRGHNPP